MRFLILVTAAVMIATLLGAQAPGPVSKAGSAPAGNAQNGKTLYVSYGCYECHDREGQGGAGTGPRLAPKPIPFVAFSAYTRHPSGQMPPYTAKVVSDKDLADIYAFLRSIPQPPPVKSIPLLNN
jgi:mono/diheme cytochrome c family protein